MFVSGVAGDTQEGAAKKWRKQKGKALPHTRQAKVGHSLAGLGGVRRRGYGGGY